MGLTRQQWTQIEALLPEALALAPAERAPYLDRGCPPELRGEVESLIAASATSGGVLDRPLVLTAPEDAGQSLAGGAVLGPWRINRLLGTGGMGEVYAAERADGSYEQRVAIKLLKRGIDTQAVIGRFLQERRILARLAHPNIARLLDAGAAGDGRPYLVMERVDGLTIDRWCEQRRLSLQQRLELMCQVCEAVYAAHREQIVHRDLKPSNVLVDKAGEVKLLDFGVSKLAGEDGGDQTQTVLGMAPLTPDYAAPEQLLGQPVTAATDVYALGLLLYRLLTGQLPHSRTSLAAAVTASGNDDRVTRPSLMLRQTRAATVPKTFRAGDLDGDLDQIVLKALQREPARRYPSAAELADDLRRHLDGRPVLARPDSRWYVMCKFVVRNWVTVSAAAAVLLAVAVGVGGIAWQARAARNQARLAEQVKNFVISVFQAQDPLGRPAKSAPAPEQMIADAIRRADEELRGEPDLYAELLGDLGEIQLGLGDTAGGEATLRRAATENEQRFGPDSRQLALCLRKLSRALIEGGRPKEASEAARQALAILQKLGQADTLEGARAKLALANATSFDHGLPRQSLDLYSDARRIFEAQLGPDDPETLSVLDKLGAAYASEWRDTEADALLREQLRRLERVFGPDSVRLVGSLTNLALVEARNGRPKEAEQFFRRAIELDRATLGPRHHRLLIDLHHLGEFYTDQGRFEEAQQTLREALSALPEGNDSDRAGVIKALGRLHLDMGQADLAEAELRQAYDAQRKRLGDDDGATWLTGSDWARALRAQGKLKEAEAFQRQALENLNRIMGPDDYNNCPILDALADTLEQEGGDGVEITALRRRSLALTEKRYPRINIQWAQRAADLARALAAADTPASRQEALALLDQAISDRAGFSLLDRLGQALLLRGRLELAAGQNDAASADLKDALAQLRRQSVPDDMAVRQAKAVLQELGAG